MEESTYYDYFHDDACGDPTTNRRLVTCNTESFDEDEFCPCPPRPGVVYVTDLNEVVYVGDFNMSQVYDAGVARITNNTPYTVCNFTFTVPNFTYVLIVPGTDVEVASGETKEFHVYIPRDLEERLRGETREP